MITRLLPQLERLIRRILSLDPSMSHELSELSGKLISLELIDTGLVIYVMPGADGINLSAEYDKEVHVRIRATPADMLAYMLFSHEGKGQSAGRLEISGDVGLAQRFQGLIKNLDPDWEEQLSNWVGDTAARKLGLLGRDALHFLATSRQSLEMNVSEYLRYEQEALPLRAEIKAFISSVDALRNDVQRMKVRIDRLQKIVSEP